MCGIIGVVSLVSNSDEVALNSLKTLEYRGYDSFGFLNDCDRTPSQIL